MSLTIVVLAGGRGERMGGVTKPLLEDQSGHTLLERIEAELAPLGAPLVAVAPAALEPALAAVWPHPVLLDHGLGPGAALLHAARTLDTEWLLLVGGDHYAPSIRLARRLLAAAASPAGAAIDVVRVLGAAGPEPLFALYRRVAVSSSCPEGQVPRLALRSFGGPDRRLELPLASLDEDEQAALRDVDTREEAAAVGLDPR